MITNLMLAVMLSSAVMLGGAGVATVANGNGICDQTQDQTHLQQKNCTCTGVNGQEHLYSWDHNYNWDHSYDWNHSYAGSV